MKTLFNMLFAIAYTANPVSADGASHRTAAATLTAAPQDPQPLGRKRRF